MAKFYFYANTLFEEIHFCRRITRFVEYRRLPFPSFSWEGFI